LKRTLMQYQIEKLTLSFRAPVRPFTFFFSFCCTQQWSQYH
jgi:hypothetical protein